MYPQQSFDSTGRFDPSAPANAPGGYPPALNAGPSGQAQPYPSQPQQLPPPQQQQDYHQQQSMSGPSPSSEQLLQPLPVPPQSAAAPAGVALAPGQEPGPAGAPTSPSKSGGFMRFFARKQPAEQGPPSPDQPPSQQPLAPSPSGGAAAAGQTSPERRRLFGILSRSNAMADQQQHAQQQQQQAQQQSLLQADQMASAPPGPGAYPAVPGSAPGQATPQYGVATAPPLQSGVPVVPPAAGLCSKAPPSMEEVARLQSSPLAASKFTSLNRAPAVSTAGSSGAGAPGETGRGAAGGSGGVGIRFRSSSAPGAASAVDPQFSGPPPLADKYGPFLRFGGYDPATRIYSASIMMVIHQSRSRYPPTLKYRGTHRNGHSEEARNPVRLFSYSGYNFWRWDMSFQLGPSPTVAEYHVVCSEDHLFTVHQRHHFHLPAVGQKWHWGFYSCNGFHDHNDEERNGGIQPLWRDVMHMHARDPLHVMFGGGDQLYCDDVWKVSSLLQWTCIQDKPSRNAHPFSQDMVNQVFDFYFRNYTSHFSKPVFSEALASIPQVMVWDDHDIFDGWGSYPPELQNCPVFAGVYFVARKFYLLFQCHAAEDNYRELNKGWGITGLSWTVMLGDSTAVVGLDTRGERNRRQIVRPASWAAFSDQIAKLPSGVRHVVVVVAVPLVYPTVPGIEEAMMALAGTGLMVSALTAFLQKTGLSSQIYSQFGEPELLDDLLDHWSARIHEVEKYCFVRMMQDLAKARGIRFSILSGDVHCAGVAAFQSMPKKNLNNDHRYMVQVISSAIGNVPPPDGVIKALSASNKPKMLDAETREKMRCMFENNTLLKAARNWCDIHERPLVAPGAPLASLLSGGLSGGPANGALVFQLRVEHPIYKEARPYTYDIEVPPLELPPGSYSAGPLPVAPPLPQPLLLKFNEELVAAGVGLEAARPLLTEGAGAFGASAGGAAAAAALATQMTHMSVSSGPPPAPPQQQVVPPPYLEAPASAAAQPPPPYGSLQGFGLQSEIVQHQQDHQHQQQAYGLLPAPPPQTAGAYHSMPSGFVQQPPPPLPPTTPAAQMQPAQPYAYGGPPSQQMYGSGAPSMPPPSGAPGGLYPPSQYAPYPHPQQPAYPPPNMQQPMAPQPQPASYYQPQHAAGPAGLYAPPAPAYASQGVTHYPAPGTAPGAGYNMPPPGANPYSGMPPPPPPQYGTYPGY